VAYFILKDGFKVNFGATSFYSFLIFHHRNFTIFPIKKKQLLAAFVDYCPCRPPKILALPLSGAMDEKNSNTLLASLTLNLLCNKGYRNLIALVK